MGVALAVAGVAALAVMGVQALRRRSDTRTGRVGRAAALLAGYEPEVQRSLTIERPVEEVYQRWHDPKTLQTVMGHFAHVEAVGDDRSHWSAPAPLGEWAMRKVEDRPNEMMRWVAEDESAPLREISVRFLPARGERGTVVTLHMRINPPDGMLGQAAARFMHNVIPGAIAAKTLRYFKSLVLTGEIPTTDRQPAARRDTH